MFLSSVLFSGMGKTGVDHRVVVRDQTGKIVIDHHRKDFASAKPLYDEMVASLVDGHEISLQHGIRIIFKARRTNASLQS
jgi:hypothetical protein